MENEQILTVVAVIAVVAVVGRIVINRQQKSGINWLKVGGVILLAAVFASVMLSVDSYRLATWASGSVESADDLHDNHVVGRKAGQAVRRAETVADGLPIYFALTVDSIAPTGYWMIKEGEAATATEREILVSKSDTAKTAIRRTTSTFSITRHPAKESRYVGIYRLTLRGGEKVLAVMADYDALRTGETPVMTSHPLTGKMADIASRQEGVGTMVYVSAFDTGYYAASGARRLLWSALVSLGVTLAVGGVGYAIIRLVRQKTHK